MTASSAGLIDGRLEYAGAPRPPLPPLDEKPTRKDLQIENERARAAAKVKAKPPRQKTESEIWREENRKRRRAQKAAAPVP